MNWITKLKPQWHCLDCDNTFRADEPEDSGVEVECPNCGSNNVEE
jgi:Zn finger protein HypA/HybF involved in hydrogenase expression